MSQQNSDSFETYLDLKKPPAVVLSSPKRPAPPINLYEIESDDSVLVTEVKKPKGRKKLSILLLKMHKRILLKARKHLTKKIMEKIEDTPGKDVSTKKDQMIKLKNNVVTLENSEKEGTHISTIRTVTNDGQQFYDDTSSLSSDDVLERVLVYHSI